MPSKRYQAPNLLTTIDHYHVSSGRTLNHEVEMKRSTISLTCPFDAPNGGEVRLIGAFIVITNCIRLFPFKRFCGSYPLVGDLDSPLLVNELDRDEEVNALIIYGRSDGSHGRDRREMRQQRTDGLTWEITQTGTIHETCPNSLPYHAMPTKP